MKCKCGLEMSIESEFLPLRGLFGSYAVDVYPRSIDYWVCDAQRWFNFWRHTFSRVKRYGES